MKPRLIIIGGGFAGLWATAAARARGGGDLDVTLVTASPEMTIRPRLYEADVNATLVPLERIVTGLGARLRIGTVTALDVDGSITLGADRMSSDALVLAAGSTSPMPPVAGLAEHGHRIDTAERAALLRHALARRMPGTVLRVTVVGGGLTGVELATELASEPGVVVTLVDAGRIGDGFGPDGEAVVRAALAELGVRTVEHARLQSVEAASATTEHGPIGHDLLVWCGGLRASPLTALVPGPRDELGRLHVDAELRVEGVAGMWAAGDVARATADGVHVAPMSCQFAIPTGRVAGHNAAAYLTSGQAMPFEVDRYVTCVDLGAAGALFTTGWERTVRKTGAEGKAMKRHINHVLIHPPASPEDFLSSVAAGAAVRIQ
jgi:NADH dehydrogenase